MKPTPTRADQRQPVSPVPPETLDGLRRMGVVLDADPAFLRAMHQRLSAIIAGCADRHDH